jgi:hypothetical protein
MITYKFKKYSFLFGVLFLNLKYSCQINTIVFDTKTTNKGVFESPKVLAESFLKTILNKDVNNFSDYYNLDIFCTLITEEIEDSIPENKIKKDELCNEESLRKIFENTVRYKREKLYNMGNKINVSDIKIINFRQVKKKDLHTSKYKFDIYNLYLKFENTIENKIYEISIFDVYHINYKWYILDPSFEIL